MESFKGSVFSFKLKRGRREMGDRLLVIGYWLLEKRKKCAEPGSVGILPAPHGVSPGV